MITNSYHFTNFNEYGAVIIKWLLLVSALPLQLAFFRLDVGQFRTSGPILGDCY